MSDVVAAPVRDAEASASLERRGRNSFDLASVLHELLEGLESARRGNERLATELGLLRSTLSITGGEQQQLEARVAGLELELERLREHTSRARALVEEQQDEFVAGLIEEHEVEVMLLDDQRRDLVTEREIVRDTLKRLQSQRDEAQERAEKLRRERDEARADASQLRAYVGGVRDGRSTAPPPPSPVTTRPPPFQLRPPEREPEPAGEVDRRDRATYRPPAFRISPPPAELASALYGLPSVGPSSSEADTVPPPAGSSRPLTSYSLGVSGAPIQPETLEGARLNSKPPRTED